VQHLRDFGRFEMNKRDLDRQREDRILVANHLGVSQFVVWLGVQNGAQDVRQNRGILNRVRFSLAPGAEAAFQTMAEILNNFFDVSFYAFTHNYSLFALLFKPFLTINIKHNLE
jgi:hypothetical protein